MVEADWNAKSYISDYLTLFTSAEDLDKPLCSPAPARPRVALKQQYLSDYLIYYDEAVVEELLDRAERNEADYSRAISLIPETKRSSAHKSAEAFILNDLRIAQARKIEALSKLAWHLYFHDLKQRIQSIELVVHGRIPFSPLTEEYVDAMFWIFSSKIEGRRGTAFGEQRQQAKPWKGKEANIRIVWACRSVLMTIQRSMIQSGLSSKSEMNITYEKTLRIIVAHTYLSYRIPGRSLHPIEVLDTPRHVEMKHVLATAESYIGGPPSKHFDVFMHKISSYFNIQSNIRNFYSLRSTLQQFKKIHSEEFYDSSRVRRSPALQAALETRALRRDFEAAFEALRYSGVPSEIGPHALVPAYTNCWSAP